jgi:hypothetical protein
MDSFLTALLERAGSDQLSRIQLMADLLAWHLRQDEEQPETVGEEFRRALVRAVGRWIEVMLNSQQANRHQFARVVNAIARFPDPQFVPGLKRMLERDLADWTRAREEHARSRGGSPLSPDVTHMYTLDYQRAFAAIGGDEVISLLRRYLPDLRFGTNAAGALFEMWNRQHPSAKTPHFASRHDYSRAKALRKQRRDAPDTHLLRRISPRRSLRWSDLSGPMTLMLPSSAMPWRWPQSASACHTERNELRSTR